MSDYLCDMSTTDHISADRLIRTWVACGLTHAVVSPGSRNAPLVLALASHPSLEIVVALDERSAAHVALGMGLQSGRPAVVVSTSGTAAVNHGPAIAEAFYQEVPLISVTADRPSEKRDWGLGQSAMQNGLFEAHTRWSCEVPEHQKDVNSLDEIARTAWRKSQRGPVHINLSLDEPLYGKSKIEVPVLAAAPLVSQVTTAEQMPEGLQDIVCQHDPRILVHLGSVALGPSLSKEIDQLIDRCGVIADVFGANGSGAESSTMRWMCGWNEQASNQWMPDAVVTVGLPPMDKRFRSLIVDWNIPHWHLGCDENEWNMFGTKAGEWRIDAATGLKELAAALPAFNGYAQRWEVRRIQLEAADSRSRNQDWVDFNVYRWLAQHLTKADRIHFANSTSARYAQWFQWNAPNLRANRGVAGIDGCLSTAVGDALMNPEVPVVAISGDAAWLYDANGLHVHPRPENLKIIVINNGGGNIFRWLKGPEESGLLERFFETGFAENMRGTAEQLALPYFLANGWDSMEEGFQSWANNSGPCLLEIQTPGEASANHIGDHCAAMGALLRDA